MDNVSVFKEVMGNYPTGVTVVTTSDGQGTPLGLTVNSFASVSIDPLLILWSIDKKVSSYEPFIKANKFAVHILAGNQSDICSLFATKGADRFANCEWELSQHNLPIIKETAGVLECETYNVIDAGDHSILIGKVIHIQNNVKDPLLYHNRKFGSIPDQFYK
ncbi:flavin reductase family protein [Evansella tamaricis]|uniref:Flavin reductase family protein n=1 Tax=Evansella tamaricis TaxID=2069301 RepID=A0ABS6J9M2_9BACI|nr:flavin reductase family protein [Evansella tamaricis]MBU9710382.1 flavin reductase family protein [Evansella tamaricis]